MDEDPASSLKSTVSERGRFAVSSPFAHVFTSPSLTPERCLHIPEVPWFVASSDATRTRWSGKISYAVWRALILGLSPLDIVLSTPPEMALCLRHGKNSKLGVALRDLFAYYFVSLTTHVLSYSSNLTFRFRILALVYRSMFYQGAETEFSP